LATVALTKIDKVEAWRGDEVEAQISALLGCTSIRVDHVLRTSVHTGQGVPALLGHITALARTHAAMPPSGRFRLAVDRTFTLRGVGVVVTGSVHAGRAHAGETVTVAPAGHVARIRALRIHDGEAASVQAGDRCALQLSGVSLDDVHRGVWITAGPNQTAQRLDVELRLLPRERPLRQGAPAHLHIGTGDLTCRIALLSQKALQPGETAMAALHLDRPVAAWAMQKFILRDQSAQRTLGGGTVLDPLPPPRQNNALRLARLDALRALDAGAAFANMLAVSVRGFDFDTFERSWNLTVAESERLLTLHQARLFANGDTKIALHADHWKAMLDQIAETLRIDHRSHPERLGLNETEIRAAVRPPVGGSLLHHAIAELCDTGLIARRGVILHLPGHAALPTPAEAELWKRVEPTLAADGVRPPRVRELVERLGIALDPIESFLARAEQLGWVHRVADNRYFLPATLDVLERIAARLAAEDSGGTFTAADFNRESGIGRNLTIQLLEYFDRIGITQRNGDRRSTVRPVS
jgi:selenocysteine-specific elongation factor